MKQESSSFLKKIKNIFSYGVRLPLEQQPIRLLRLVG